MMSTLVSVTRLHTFHVPYLWYLVYLTPSVNMIFWPAQLLLHKCATLHTLYLHCVSECFDMFHWVEQVFGSKQYYFCVDPFEIFSLCDKLLASCVFLFSTAGFVLHFTFIDADFPFSEPSLLRTTLLCHTTFYTFYTWQLPYSIPAGSVTIVRLKCLCCRVSIKQLFNNQKLTSDGKENIMYEFIPSNVWYTFF